MGRGSGSWDPGVGELRASLRMQGSGSRSRRVWDPRVEVKEFRNPVAGVRGSGIQCLGPRALGTALSGSCG